MTDSSNGKTELEIIAQNAGLRLGRDNPPPNPEDCKACVDPNAPGAKTIKELQELYKYMYGKATQKKDRTWLESKVLGEQPK